MDEAGNMTMDEARALVSNQLLWPRVRDFLWDFAPSIHESWIGWLEGGDEGPDGGDAGREPSAAGGRPSGNPSLRLPLSVSLREMASPFARRFLLDSLHVGPCFHAFSKEDCSRLLLLDGATLESVVKWLGALACADSLRRVTDGATVRGLRSALPGVYPEVFGYTAYFKSKVESLEVESPDADMVVSAGWKILSSSLSHLPECLLRRLALKLPRRLGHPDPRLPAFDLRLSTATLQLLLKLRFPEAYSLCFS